jgi:lipopolysaccharide export system permease protein
VRIITRYIVREHIGPLVFALTALTSLLLLQYVARQLDKLVGKGLPWRVIGEFLLLSLPFTIAMTLPMAVLVSTLHAFGRLASEHEVTAFKASGVRVRRLMAPMLAISAVLSLLMVGFNDQVLPRANHRLSILLGDIVNVRPTVGLRAQVLSQLSPTFYMKVGWLDETSNRMRDVEIYDLQNTAERKSVYADSGTFTMSPDSVDLQLVLYDGEQLQFAQGDAQQLQRTFFRQQLMKVKDLARGFSSSEREGAYKGEREQGICELQREYVARAEEYESRRLRWIAQLRAEAADSANPNAVLRVPRPRPAHGGLARLYCEKIPALLSPKSADAATVPLPIPMIAAFAQTQQDTTVRDSLRRDSIARAQANQDSAASQVQQQAEQMRRQAMVQDSLAGEQRKRDSIAMATGGVILGADGLPIGQAQNIADSMAAAARAAAALDPNRPPPAIFAVTPEALQAALMDMSKYAVEVQKKFALSMACFVFVLFGPPIALRFPRGGVGVTIGVSLVVFGAYYVCLMAGETLADKGTVEPVIAMWAANVIFTLAGLVLLLRVEKTADGSRGGGLRDWWMDRRARKSRQRAARTALRGAGA